MLAQPLVAVGRGLDELTLLVDPDHRALIVLFGQFQNDEVFASVHSPELASTSS